MQYIIGLLTLIIMIILHEWGHFIAGRICKTPIHEFAIGMGPLIYQKKGKKETIFSLRAIPIGGYCAFDAEDSTGVVDSSLNELSVYKRLFIFIAGPLMNVITAIFVFFAVAMFTGFPQTIPIVDSITEDGAAFGILQEGDEIIAINGKEIKGDSNLMTTYIGELEGAETTVTIIRNNEEMDVFITPNYDEINDRYVLGIMQSYKYYTLSFIESVKYSFSATIAAVVSTYQSLIGLIMGQYKISDMSGVVGVVSYMGSYASPSTSSVFLSLCGLISVNLGIMNLLPIPGLDGSKVLFGIIEAITRKKIPQKIETAITLVGFGFLMLLFVVITFSDIVKLF